MLRLRWPFEWVRVIKLRDLPDDVALEEVWLYFKAAEKANQDVYCSDTANDLRLPLEQVTRVCGMLVDDGKIASV